MILKNEKMLFQLNSEITTEPKHADRIPLREAMDKLYSRQIAGDCVKLLKSKTASLRIHDMDIDYDNDIVYMLIHYSDMSISDPVFGELKSGKLRKESKLDGEGIAVSAHVAFSLTPIHVRGGIYDAILEEAPGVGRSLLTPFFNSEFKEVSDFKFSHNKKEYNSRPLMLLTGRMSKGLEEDIEKGRFRGITLIKYDVQDFMDEDSIMKTTQSSIKLKIDDGINFKNLNPKKIIKSIFQQAKSDGYNDLKVHYTRENKRTKTVSINTKLADAMDVIYTKSKAIILNKSVDQCVSKFNTEIQESMKGMLLSGRKANGKAENKRSKMVKLKKPKKKAVRL